MTFAAGSFVGEVLAALEGATDVNPLFARIDREAAMGEPEALLELHAALAQPTADVAAGAAQSLRGRIEESLALTPRAENLEACLSLVRTASGALPRPRTFAARLAQGQLPSDLLRVFAREREDGSLRELLACVLHELVARGMDCTGEPAAEALQARLADDHHPLAWLPLTRAEVERSLEPRSFVPGSSGWSLRSQGAPPTSAARLDDTVSPQPIDDAALFARLRAAVAGWEESSNGIIETAAFSFERPLTPDAVGPRFLGSLGLVSVGNEDVAIWQVEPERAIRVLFTAAAFGGAYGGEVEHAYGRLQAWRSLVALCGGGPSLTFAEALEQLAKSDLFEFETREPWFSQVAWDLALLGLSPSRDRVTVLAATDTD